MDAYNTGIVLIDAPTGAGKTRYIKSLGATQSNTLTSEQLVDELLQMCMNKISLINLAEKLQHIHYFENMESLSRKEKTQRLAAQLVQIMAVNKPVILTGIDFKLKLPFFLEELGAEIEFRSI